MKHSKGSNNTNVLNLSNKVLLIFGTPLLTWQISYLNQFSGLEKISLLTLSIVLLLGTKMIYSGLSTQTQKKAFSKRRYAIKDLNLKLSSTLSPQVITTLAIAGIIGGISGYYFLNETLFTLVGSGATFFVIVLGIEFLFQDLVIKTYNIK